MHETGIAADILAAARDAISGREGFRVSLIRLRAGPWQSLDPGSLAFAFGVLAADDPAFSGAVLEVAMQTPGFTCGGCGAKGKQEDLSATCPECGSADLRLEGCADLVLEAIEGTGPSETE